ncbi:hypothetical protein F0237_09845 [Vibrio tubiashii]|uniref:Uncharacterized protein n=1 Tax=Vibrio tubiashii TaxID=29498 RepID=A0AAE5GQ42_9VIBR|nr:hypothetical protein [Vibrio tubiashii]
MRAADPLKECARSSDKAHAMPAAPSFVANAAAMAEIRSHGSNRHRSDPSRLHLACLDRANTHRP